MATDLMYTTNPNEWTRLEGVYVNRKKPDPRITGANVNTVGMLFSSVRGPQTPQIVGSPAQATALYGGRDAGGHHPVPRHRDQPAGDAGAGRPARAGPLWHADRHRHWQCRAGGDRRGAGGGAVAVSAHEDGGAVLP